MKVTKEMEMLVESKYLLYTEEYKKWNLYTPLVLYKVKRKGTKNSVQLILKVDSWTVF